MIFWLKKVTLSSQRLVSFKTSINGLKGTTLLKSVSSFSQARSIVFSFLLVRGNDRGNGGQNAFKSAPPPHPSTPAKKSLIKEPMHADGSLLEIPDTYEWNLSVPACIELDTTAAKAKGRLRGSLHEKQHSRIQGSLSGDTILTSFWPLLFSSALNIKNAIQ